jgi:ribosomal protein S18 acetylase RimI-like enzyme
LTSSIVEVGQERLDDLEPLWQALHEHHAALSPPQALVRPFAESWRRQRRRYERLFASEGARLYLAADGDGTLTGYALTHLAPGLSIWQTTDTVVLVETLSVAAHLRGRGIGTALIERVQDEARRRHGAETWLSVLSTNDDAVRFYEQQGYVRFSIELRRA